MFRMAYLAIPLVVSALVLLLFVLSWLASRPADLGVQADGRLKDCPGTPNCVCSQASRDSDRLPAFTFEGDAKEAWQRLKTVILAEPRVKIVSESETYLHVEFTSLLFRFVDDVECLLDVEGRNIQVRSASRVGKSDLGVNRERVERLRRSFEAKR
jgi:uncharacterized protein (DUF1499 family)